MNHIHIQYKCCNGKDAKCISSLVFAQNEIYLYLSFCKVCMRQIINPLASQPRKVAFRSVPPKFPTVFPTVLQSYEVQLQTPCHRSVQFLLMKYVYPPSRPEHPDTKQKLLHSCTRALATLRTSLHDFSFFFFVGLR